jgi:hypothetical protein
MRQQAITSTDGLLGGSFGLMRLNVSLDLHGILPFGFQLLWSVLVALGLL